MIKSLQAVLEIQDEAELMEDLVSLELPNEIISDVLVKMTILKENIEEERIFHFNTEELKIVYFIDDNRCTIKYKR